VSAMMVFGQARDPSPQERNRLRMKLRCPIKDYLIASATGIIKAAILERRNAACNREGESGSSWF